MEARHGGSCRDCQSVIFRCQLIRESDGARCRLKPEHVGRVPCKFDASAPKPAQAIPAESLKPVMNAGETRYAQHLDLRILAGDVKRYWFEGMTFRLAKRTSYRTDFLVLMADGSLECREVKGAKRKRNGKTTFWAEEDAKLKIKVAAEMFGAAFVFRIVWPGEHGTWNEQRV
jgi:hypothetical protein